MKVSREQFQQNRERILEAAGQLFRERGLDAVSVADVMQAAGLTHGGFYGHFRSKDDLIAEACRCAADTVLEGWREEARADGPEALQAIARRYLSAEHRDGAAEGCLMAALGPELARRGQGVRKPVDAINQGIVGVLQQMAPGASPAARRKQAIAAYAAWIGAMVLARISEDDAFSDEVLAAAAEMTCAQA